MNTHLSNCPVCNTKAAFHTPEIQPQAHDCPVCKEKRVFTPVANHPNIKFLHKVFQKYPARVHFACSKFANLFITVDSVWSHLSAAYNKPSVIIYSNYHPYTRTKYYDKCSIVTPDYDKDCPCGPCNALVGFCHMHPEQHAPCTSTIRTEQIIDAANEQLSGVLPAYQELRDNSPISYDIGKETRPCPMCGCRREHWVTAKGEFMYTRCHDCGSIYTTKYPDATYWENLPRWVQGKSYYRPSRNNKPQDIINGIQKFLKEVSLPLLKEGAKITDLVTMKIPDSHCKRIALCTQDMRFVARNELSEEPIPDSFVLSIEGLSEQENPEEFLTRIFNCMKPNQVFAAIVPLADRYNGVNSWAGVNAVVRGLNTIIPSKKGLSDMLTNIGFKNVFVGHNDVSGMVIATR